MSESRTWLVGCAAAVALWAASGVAAADELTVGPGKKFASIAEAYAKVSPGDTVLVFPREGNAPYEKVAVMVRKERITFKAAAVASSATPTASSAPAAGTSAAKAAARVALSGKGFDYTGAGSVPRAMFQFDPQASGCVLEGFELLDAHNDDCNGAGVRINQANDVTIRNCEIHACDMGIMSNGNGTPKAGVNQRIEGCLIHGNGNAKQAGYNHNLYLGGTSVTLSGCEVHSSLTGHNVKSRAHFTQVEYSYIHDSANREFDLVDAKGDTDTAGSDAVLLGNVIVKDPKCSGNRTTIHFGQDGGKGREGTLWLVHNTIVTPFVAPVVDMSTGKVSVKFINNILWDGGSGQKGQVLVKGFGGKTEGTVSGAGNWLGGGFAMPAGTDGRPALDGGYTAKDGEAPPFVDAAKRDYHLKSPAGSIVGAGVPWSKVALPTCPLLPDAKPPADAKPAALRQYLAPLKVADRPGFRADAKGDVGAFSFATKE